MRRAAVSKKNYETGVKRINLAIPLRDFENLHLVAEYRNLPVTTLCASWAVETARNEAEKIRKRGYVPLSQRGESLFKKGTAE